jgi:hypothetical protein
MSLEHSELTERIIGAAIEVHRRLVPGFLVRSSTNCSDTRSVGGSCGIRFR